MKTPSSIYKNFSWFSISIYCCQTNLYYFYYQEILGLPWALRRSFLAQIKSFIGVLFLMGINRRAKVKGHWSNYPLLQLWTAKIIPQNRFWLIYRFLHLNDNSSLISMKLLFAKRKDRIFTILIKTKPDKFRLYNSLYAKNEDEWGKGASTFSRSKFIRNCYTSNVITL